MSLRIKPGEELRGSDGDLYRMVQILGTGGNAATFLVGCTTSPFAGQFFAMKIFRKVDRDDRLQAFLAELSFLETCNHPAVMRVFGKGTYDSPDGSHHPFVVAELFPSTLRHVMRGGLSMGEKLMIATQLCGALVYLHSLKPQVIHRDIKPENIFIKGHNCILGDFGLMKLVNGKNEENEIAGELLKSSTGAGMPFFYRTPDLVSYLQRRSSITVKSDVFQLGLVLAELFTGWNPCKRTNSFEDEVELEPLGWIAGKYGSQIAVVLRLMLTKNPQFRVGAFSALKHWLDLWADYSLVAAELNGEVV